MPLPSTSTSNSSPSSSPRKQHTQSHPPTSKERSNLSLISELFNQQVELIRNEKHDNLEELAKSWLINARMKIMMELRKEYSELERSKGDPLSQSDWSLNSGQRLYLRTERVPEALSAYKEAFSVNIEELLKECGFNVENVSRFGNGDLVYYIHFPLRLQRGNSNPVKLEVQDCFSNFNSSTSSPFMKLLKDMNE